MSDTILKNDRPKGGRLWTIVTEGLTPKEKLIARRIVQALAVLVSDLAMHASEDSAQNQ